MRAFLILALASVALARPEAGYSYQGPSGGGAPSGSYGTPSFGGGSANLGPSVGGGGFGGGSSGGFGGGAPSGSYGAPGFGGGSANLGPSIGGGGCGFGGAGGPGCGGGSQGPSFGPAPSSGGTLIQKHIYVHVPPPEPEEQRPQRQFGPAPQAQKHYKIIFIKAPTPPTPTAPAIPQLPAQDEQKTLIYVLVKKPEEAPEFSLPTVAPTQPSKPEVYFIKYKTQKEGGANLGGGIDQGLGAGPDAGIGGGPGPSGPSSNYGPPGGSGPY